MCVSYTVTASIYQAYHFSSVNWESLSKHLIKIFGGPNFWIQLEIENNIITQVRLESIISITRVCPHPLPPLYITLYKITMYIIHLLHCTVYESRCEMNTTDFIVNVATTTTTTAKKKRELKLQWYIHLVITCKN